MRTYHLFISHSWSYSDSYYNITGLLDRIPRSRFRYSDYSVPKDDPLHTNGTDRQLYNAIKEQISHSSVVLILAGVYATHSKWIDKEIYIAQNEFTYTKPIIAVEPRGSERTSVKVKDAADEIVKWNTKSIISAIRDVS